MARVLKGVTVTQYRINSLLLAAAVASACVAAQLAYAVEDIARLSDDLLMASDNGLKVYRINAHEGESSQSVAMAMANSSQALFTHEGQYEALDVRQLEDGSSLIAANNTKRNSVDVYRWQTDETFVNSNQVTGSPKGEASLTLLNRIPVEGDLIESVCLHQDKVNQHIHAFILKTQQPIEQRLVFDEKNQIATNVPVRELPMSFGVTSCTVDDEKSALYVAEESVGVWQFDAHPEAELGREPVAMIAPFGRLKSDIKDIALLKDGSLLVSQADAKSVARISLNVTGESSSASGFTSHVMWQTLGNEVEVAQGVWSASGQLYVSAVTEDSSQMDWVAFAKGKWLNAPKTQPSRLAFTPVQPVAETLPVARHGDAADDPAIWVHPSQPEKSLILGTDKKSGLGVYDLSGKQTQFLPTGRLNNVDVRGGFTYQGKTVSLAAASNRDNNSIALYGIDDSGWVSEIGEVMTSLDEVYGLCMFHDVSLNQHVVFINDKDGRYQQYRINSGNAPLSGTLVREFAVHDQPEGCVANDHNGDLFVGVEDHGVWLMSAKEKSPATWQEVLRVGGAIQDDVEGLALYQQGDNTLLVVSSQGNDSYGIFDAFAPFTYRGSVQISANVHAGIDGASETDGLAVTSASLGDGLTQGLLVVQDGRNVMPVEPQNFKLVPFDAILKGLHAQ